MVTVTIDQLNSRVSSLSRWQQAAYDEVASHWATEGEANKKCGVIVQRGVWAGKPCAQRAGQGTDYKGIGGHCVAHGGAKKQGRAIGAWHMAHSFAQELDVSPWEALLLVIRITAGRVRYCEAVIGSAVDDREIEGRISSQEPTGVGEDGSLTTGRNLTWWVDTSERERDRLARVSKAAIDAGVAQLLIEKELRAGEELAGTFVKSLQAMEAAGMPEESLEIARAVMRKELQLALES
jgi:hypothetical protein